MKPNWLSVIIAFLLGIGLTYLVLPRVVSPQDNCDPFVVQEKSTKRSLTSPESVAPLDTTVASLYVRNYKNRFPGGTFAFTILGTDIQEYLNHGNFAGIRVYLGLTLAGNPASGTVIVTGVNGQGGDLYLQTTGRESAVDQSTPCPTDCPNRRSLATQPNEGPATSRDMLGRMASDPQ